MKSTKKFTSNKLYFILIIIIYKCVLDYSYIKFVHQVYLYGGFELEFERSKYFISWIVTLVLLKFIRHKMLIIADYASIFLYLLVLLPVCTMFGLDGNRPWEPLAMVTFSQVLLVFVSRVPLPKISRIPLLPGGFKIAILLSVICVSGVTLNYTISGISFNLDFTRVYDYRAANAAISSGGYFSYINSWAYKVFNILLICMSLYYRRYILLVLFILIQVFFYAATAHKLVVLLPVLVLSVWFFFRKSRSLTFMPLSLTVLIIVCLLMFTYFNFDYASTMFIRRLFFVPANLNYVYYDYFSMNAYFLWSDSVLKYFLDNPYNQNISHTIGTYLGQPTLGANNGLISSGYAQAGFFGVFLYTITFGLILRFAQFMVNNALPIWFGLALLVVPITNTLLNSDLLTTFLTHGLAVSVLMLYLIASLKLVKTKE